MKSLSVDCLRRARSKKCCSQATATIYTTMRVFGRFSQRLQTSSPVGLERAERTWNSISRMPPCGFGSSERAARLAMSHRSFARPMNLWGRTTMETRHTDPIIAELRSIRQAYAARFNYDVEAMFRDIRARQDASGRDYVRLPARRAVSATQD